MSNVQAHTILEHFRSLSTTKLAIGEAGRRHQNGVKAANKDGINSPMLIQAIAYVRADPDKSKANLCDFLHYLKVLQADTGPAQIAMDFTLPDDEAWEMQQNWNTEQDGIEAGRTGGLREANPYNPGTDRYSAYDNGWILGHQKLEDGLGPKRRGRPPKAAEQTEGQESELRAGPERDDIDDTPAPEKKKGNGRRQAHA